MTPSPPQPDHAADRDDERATQPASPGLYVHVPFCVSKCPYCDFHSETNLDTLRDWLNSVAAEAKLYEKRFAPFGTLYMGGGTPSMLGPGDFKHLAGTLFDTFSFEDGFEFTLEANPDDLDRDILALYRSLGVNRLSIGVQSFSDEELRLLGRRHDGARAARAIESAREAGLGNISIDLIYAIPGQTAASWRDTLERALGHEPEHISCYELTVEEGTPLSRMFREEEVMEAGEETKRELFFLAHEILTGRGYIHYEVSNYARDSERRSKHNSRYWDHTPYLGLGPSAHSFASGERWWNIDDVSGYCRMLEVGEAPVAGREKPSENQLLLERLYFGFRTLNGFPKGFFDSLPGGGETLAELERTALVRIEKSRVVPTPLGFLFSDGLPPLFSAG
jgi:putative oxygen-independent coproporphyrinogen III oxidase